ncbi:transposase (plasmid) [Azospirillum sp. A26]|uniref:IS701 family transposase n=1 Tax=Azospirillum sp. A26 TaxID=3160607 RepID=UPI003670DF1D
MSPVPDSLERWMAPFVALFTRPTWRHVLVLVAGALLTPGRRTVTAALSIMGRRETGNFANFHRVLNRNRWSGRAVAQRLFTLLIATFVPQGPVVIGIDETIERRWGSKIKARGIYRDPVRSSHGHFVKASGLRWIVVMLLVPISWAGRVWALPFLSALAPSERFARETGRRHKKLTDWARQLLLQVRRWVPDRQLIVVADSSYAAIELLSDLRAHLTVVTRLRLDARLFEPAPLRSPGTIGRPRVSGSRLPSLAQRLEDAGTSWRCVRVNGWYGGGDRQLEISSGTALWYHPGKQVPIRWVLVRDVQGGFEPQGFLCTDLQADPLDVLRWFVRRWAVDGTFAEVRRHLGVETQRQWADQAIARTTPALLGLFSLVTLWANDIAARAAIKPRAALWYRKAEPTFSDALAAIRLQLWREMTFSASASHAEIVKPPDPILNRLIHAVCLPA